MELVSWTELPEVVKMSSLTVDGKNVSCTFTELPLQGLVPARNTVSIVAISHTAELTVAAWFLCICKLLLLCYGFFYSVLVTQSVLWQNKCVSNCLDWQSSLVKRRTRTPDLSRQLQYFTLYVADSKSDTRTPCRPTRSASTLHRPSWKFGPTGDRTAKVQSSSLKQVVFRHWKPNGHSGRQGRIWSSEHCQHCSVTSVHVLVRRGSGYRRSHLSTWV